MHGAESLIPITMFAGGFAMIFGIVYLRTRQNLAMIAKGMNPILAKQQALSVLDKQITAQASVLAFSRIYILSGVILLCVLPLLFLFKTGKGRGSSGMAH